MKNIWKPTNLPAVTAAFGGIALVLRKLLYAVAVDEKGLLPAGHPLEIALGVVSAAALLVILLSVRKLDGSQNYEDNFAPDKMAMAGHMAAALGILLTVLTSIPVMDGYLGQLWWLLGCITPVCLALTGLDRMRGKMPFFLLQLVPCLFLVFHILNHYRMWSGNPQLQDYVFTLFGTMALMLFAFYSAAFSVGAGNRRMQLGMGLAAVYLCMGELAVTQYPWLYLGGIFWALTGLCSLIPTATPTPKAGEES